MINVCVRGREGSPENERIEGKSAASTCQFENEKKIHLTVSPKRETRRRAQFECKMCAYEHRRARGAVGRRGKRQSCRSPDAELRNCRPLSGWPQRGPHRVRGR